MKKAITLVLFTSLVFSCTRDVVPERDCDIITPQTYQETKLIINEYCAYSGCHLNNAAPGNFNTYDGVKEFLDTDVQTFRSDVASKRMPPVHTEQELSELAILQIVCWLEQGYPEE